MSNDQRQPAMKSMLVAVFGHYNSRGGTTAIPIKESTEAEVARAKKKFNKECFGIDEAGDEIDRTVYGMPARAADKAVHALMYRDTTPAEDDFMYIAEIHYPEDVSLEGDLQGPEEHLGFDEPRADVMKRPWRDVLIEGSYKTEGKEEDGWRLGDPPIKLEVIRYIPEHVHGDLDADEERDHGATQAAMDAVNPPKEGNYFSRNIVRGFSSEEPESIKLLRAAYTERNEQRDREREKRKADCCRVIEDAREERWDDDAFGFIIGTGLEEEEK